MLVAKVIVLHGLVAAFAVASPLFDGEEIPTAQYGARMYGLPDLEFGKKLDELDVTQTNPEEIGPYLEGDMLIPGPVPKNGIVGNAYRWPNGRIPYVIAPTFSARGRELIFDAFDAYHETTCIRFEPKTAADRDYISIEHDGSGCWSSVGRTGRGKQVVNLQEPGCTTLPGTSMHELMHAVGFMHEQNRDDRDGWIEVNYDNIRQGLEPNFHKISGMSAQGVAYDYGSVMHYGLSSFSKNGRPTMTALKSTNAQIGQRRQMSPLDVKKINQMYNCPRKEEGIPEIPEPFGGIFSNIFGLTEIKNQDIEEQVPNDIE